MAYKIKLLYAFIATLTILSVYPYTHVYGMDRVLIHMEDDPVWSSSDPSNPGFLLEVVMEMTKYLGIEPVKAFLPWKRAQDETIHGTDSIIFPLARTYARENQYRWLVKLFDVPVAFIAKGNGPLINTYGEAAAISKIGVLSGTPQEEKLNEIQHGKDIQLNVASIKAKNIYNLFSENRVEVLYGGVPEALYAWQRYGYKKRHGKLKWGAVLQKLPLWIGTGKNTRLKSEEWEDALEKVKASGFYEKAYNKYFKQ